jgi:hypothetical protein
MMRFISLDQKVKFRVPRQLAVLLVLAMASTAAAAPFVMSLDAAREGELPPGWTAAKTGTGAGSVWKVVADQDKKKVLAQSSDRGANGFFNLCVAENTRFVDVDLSVRFKAVAGKLDQGGGPVWRFKDANSYYIARMNPLENNFRVYKVVGGKRIQLASADVQAAAGQWHTIRILQWGVHIVCYLNGKAYLDVRDDTFKHAGQIGLWTKADAQTYFMDLHASDPNAAPQTGEQAYDGKTVSEWIVLAKNKDTDLQLQAVKALARIGTPAVPALAELLKDQDLRVRKSAAEALGNIGSKSKAVVPTMVQLLMDERPWVRESALLDIGGIGPDAKAAVPALIELLDDKSYRWDAAYTLGQIGPGAKESIPALTKLLKASDGQVRGIAVWALGNMGPDANAAVPALKKILKDEDPNVRQIACEAIEQITPALPSVPQGKTWKLVWHDEFDGTELDETKWTVPPDAPRKGGWWMRKAIALDGEGHLVISTLKEGDKVIDGCVNTQRKFEHSFGYYVARVQFQKQPGHWSAFWINGPGVTRVGSGGREGTEIDIMEKPWRDERVQHTLHWDGYGKDHKSLGKVAKVPGVMEGWHTFGLWWKPDEYVYYVDGKETWRTKASGVCQVPEHILLSDEVGNWGGDIKRAKLPDRFLVDYVRVYDVVEQK